MQVATDVAGLDERRRRAAKRILAELRRTPGDPEGAVDGRLVGSVRHRLERRDVRGRARGSQEGRPGALGLGDRELDGDAVERHAHRPPLALLENGDDLRQCREACERRCRVLRGAHHGQLLAPVAPAAHIARGLRAESARDAFRELAGAV